MKRIRIASLLLVVPLTFLAACGGDDTNAGSQPTGTFSAVPSAPATSSAPAVSDLELCKSAQAALKTMLTTLAGSVDSNGNVPPAESKKAVKQAGESLSKAAESGGSGDVAAALKDLSAEVSKASEAADPFKAADSPSFTTAGEKFDAACKKAGFTPGS